MKVLVATKEHQGDRTNDFFWCRPGELVKFSMECDGEEIDGDCGCRRAMSGVESQKATTTMKVEDRPDLDRHAVIRIMRAALDKGGWTNGMPERRAARWAAQEADDVLTVAEQLPTGAIVERRGNKFVCREVPNA